MKRSSPQDRNHLQTKMVSSEISKNIPDNLRIDPEKRLCPSYDYLSIAEYRVASQDKMGFRVIDNAAQEHIM